MGAAVLFLVGLVSLFNLALGFIILLSDARKLSSYLFFGVCLSVCVWTGGIGLFLAASDQNVAISAARAYYAAAAMIGYFLLAFSIEFTGSRRNSTLLMMLTVPLIAVVGFSLSNNGLVDGVDLSGNNNVAHLDSSLYSYYSYFFMSYMYLAIAWIGIKLFVRPAKTAIRKQLLYIFIALLLAGTFGTYFNLILPLFGDYSLIWVGPLFSIIMVALVFTAIVKHNLFDVRQAIARTVAYALLLITLATIYSAVVFAAARIFFSSTEMSPIQSVVNTTFAVFLAFTYQPLKRFFDRVTNRLFFRASYDLQAAIDQLGSIIVTSRTTRNLITKIYELIDKTLHPEALEVIALDSTGAEVHSKRTKKMSADMDLIGAYTKNIGVVMKRKEHGTPDELDSYMDEHGIAAIVKLNTSNRVVGYILVGDKKSSTYTANDERLLTVIRDEMSVAFENAMHLEEIEQFNETLKKNVLDATSELRSSNRKLKSLDASKDEFISMASHQLRTPLTSVKGYISMVLDGDMGDITPQQRKVLEEAYASSQRMVYLIGDFLNVSRLQTGKFELEISPAKLAFIIEQEIEQLRATAAARGIKLAYAAPDNFPDMDVDENKIRQVMMNFIDNAIYYSPSDTTITVQLMKYAHHISFKVIDQGIGVPKSEQPRLFTKFYRASNAKQQRPDGTGIGLYMAKKVIVAHGGEVVFDTKENEGSTFGFRLPLPKPSSDDTDKLEN